MSRRGHHVSVLAGGLGDLAEEIRSFGVTVVDDVLDLHEVPDIIHGHHGLPSVLAMARFPDVPAVWMSHDFRNWYDKPPKLSRIYRYLPVDVTRWKYLVEDQEIPPERVEVLHNAVDLKRIPARVHPLPDRPRRLLAFTKTGAQLPAIGQACSDLGLEFGTLGHGTGRLSTQPEHELVVQDIVVGAGRAAIAALCAGAAVIVGDARGFAGLVTSANYQHFRDLNFGSDTFTQSFCAQVLKTEIGKYDRADAIAVTAKIRV